MLGQHPQLVGHADPRRIERSLEILLPAPAAMLPAKLGINRDKDARRHERGLAPPGKDRVSAALREPFLDFARNERHDPGEWDFFG